MSVTDCIQLNYVATVTNVFQAPTLYKLLIFLAVSLAPQILPASFQKTMASAGFDYTALYSRRQNSSTVAFNF
jgi:hypothetical protein